MMKIKKFGALLVSAVLCIGMAAPAFAYEAIPPRWKNLPAGNRKRKKMLSPLRMRKRAH